MTHLKSHGTKLPGDIIQMLRTVKTDITDLESSEDTFTDISGMSVAITVQSAANQVDVQAALSVSAQPNGGVAIKLVRGSTDIGIGDANGSRDRGSAMQSVSDNDWADSIVTRFLDDPGSSGSITYKVQWRSIATGISIYLNRSHTDSDDSDFLRTASSIFASEIMG